MWRNLIAGIVSGLTTTWIGYLIGLRRGQIDISRLRRIQEAEAERRAQRGIRMHRLRLRR